jgi:ribose-phosphate pyrophosphokinase
MNNEIEIFLENKQYKSESFLFSGGELQVKIRPILQSNTYEELTILCRIQSSNDLVRLILVKEIIDRRSHRGNKKLVIPYFPYARQDRIMEDETESFSLKSISKIINDLKFDEVVTCDPHSDVTAALVNNIKIINQLQLVDKHRDLQELLKTKI